MQFDTGVTRKSLGLAGEETISIIGIEGDFKPGMRLTMRIAKTDGAVVETPLLSRIDTENEAEYYRHGGILRYVLRKMAR